MIVCAIQILIHIKMCFTNALSGLLKIQNTISTVITVLESSWQHNEELNVLESVKIIVRVYTNLDNGGSKTGLMACKVIVNVSFINYQIFAASV